MKFEIDESTRVFCDAHKDTELEAALHIGSNSILVKPCPECTKAMVKATAKAARATP